MKYFFNWLERLSLDAVVVAVVWGLALGKDTSNPAMLLNIVILGSATWLTYVSDRLWEVRPGKDIPATDRHVYYRNHYKLFMASWVTGFVATFIAALLVLPLWKISCGCILVGVIVVYLVLLGRMVNLSARLLIKRTIMPIVFTAGVVLMSESWSTADGIAGSILLLSAALVNVLLISYWESHDKTIPGWLLPYLAGSLLLLLCIANVALFLHWPSGIAGLLCAAGYFVLFIQVKTGKARFVRAWVDGVLATAGLIVILM